MYDEAMRCINRDAPTTEKTLPTAFKAPGQPVAKETEAMTTLFYFVESDVHKFRDDCFIDAESMGVSGLHIYNQVDWKLNDGPWHYTEDWDTLSVNYPWNSAIYPTQGSISLNPITTVGILDLRYEGPVHDELGDAMNKGTVPTENSLTLKTTHFTSECAFLQSFTI